MADINLSKAVRSNLLSLQSTAANMAKTQNRLATGLKVNSALDNPSNFFTASALNSRAGDMANLLDSMASGIQTIEAADNGLKSITKTLESMQSTLRQARQDKTFQTASYTIPEDAAFAAGDKISFSGGAVGETATDINLTKGTAGTSAAGAFSAFSIEGAAAGTNSITYDDTEEGTDFAAGDEVAFTVNIDGGGDAIATIDLGIVQSVGNGNDAIDSIEELQAAMAAAIDAEGTYTEGVDYSISNDGTDISITSLSQGASSSVVITDTNGDADGADLDSTFGIANGAGTDGSDADSISFGIAVDGGDATTVTLTAAQVAAVGNGDQTIDDLDEYQAVVQAGLQAAGVTDVTVGQNDDGTALTFSSITLGTASSVEITNVQVNDNNTTDTLDVADTGLNALTETAGAAEGGVAKTVDELSFEINRDLAGKVRASNDNGKLRIENQSTQELDVGGVASDGNVDGSSSAGNTTIGGNTVREGLSDQFRELRDQLDKLVDDASFNGVNLLRGDNLQITFNETGTSELNIQTNINNTRGASVNSATLGLETNLQAADLDSDANIDVLIAEVKTAIDTVRSQSSAFGSSLSIVENRTDFTKNMINTLETGAANLTLADTNEEAANLLALQTRQQLSSTALSMASQSDQAVLRLF